MLACVPRGCGELGVRVESALLWSRNPTRPIRAHQAFARLPVRRLGAVPVQLRNGEVGKPKAMSGKKRAEGPQELGTGDEVFQVPRLCF